MTRKHIPLKTKLASALLAMRTPNERGELVPVIDPVEAKSLTADQIISRWDWDHTVFHAIGGSDHPSNLTPMLREDHREKTRSDVSKIAKSKRVERKHKEHLARLRPPVEAEDEAEAVRNQSKPRPRSKIRSRGFPKKGKGVMAGNGPPCPRCGGETTAFRHPSGYKPNPHKGHYAIWYYCKDGRCPTKQIMPNEHYVPPPAGVYEMEKP